MYEALFKTIRSYYENRNLGDLRLRCGLRDELDEYGKKTLSDDDIRCAVFAWLKSVGELSEDGLSKDGKNIDDCLDVLNDALIARELGKKLIEIGYEEGAEINTDEAITEFLMFCTVYAEIRCRLYQVEAYGKRLGYEIDIEATDEAIANFAGSRHYK